MLGTSSVPGQQNTSNLRGRVSGQSALFQKYLALWPDPNHEPRANTDFVNNRYDKIKVTRPTDKYFFRMDKAFGSSQHLSGSVSRSALTNDIPAPFQHAAESVTTDTDWSGSLLYTLTLNPKTVLNVRLGCRSNKPLQ